MKKEQEEAVRGFVNGKDVFIALAKGFKKSLCYSLLQLVSMCRQVNPQLALIT